MEVDNYGKFKINNVRGENTLIITKENFEFKEYIINSFIKYKDRRLSNGPIEGINKRVKELKAIMSGYRNTKRFYKRIILIQNIEKGR